MSSLAELLDFNPLTTFHIWAANLAYLKMSHDALYFLWYDLSSKTRSRYNSVIKSYEFYCSQVGLLAWLAIVQSLVEWAIGRVINKPLISFQKKVKPETIIAMISVLRSIHINRQYSLTPFKSP